MTFNYLDPANLASALMMSGAIEQWLGHTNSRDYRTISWLRIERGQNHKILISKFDVFDDGSEDFLDIYEFEAIDPDNAFGVTVEFSTLEDALAYGHSQWGADITKYVKAGEIQLVYKSFLLASGPPPSV